MPTHTEDTRIELSTERLVELLREAVAEKPEDYSYPSPTEDVRYHLLPGVASCKYFLDNGEPACIIGVVLDKLGLKPPEGRHSSSGAYAVLAHTTKLDPEGLALAAHVQHRQDRYTAWGQAVENAVKAYAPQLAQ